MFDPSFQSPEAVEAYRRKLHRIVTYHRWLLIVIVVNIGLVALLMATAIFAGDWLKPVIQSDFVPNLPTIILANLVYLLTIAPVVLLTKEWANTPLAIICAVILIIGLPPILFLQFVLTVGYHFYALRYFKQNDIRVGLFGADRSMI